MKKFTITTLIILASLTLAVSGCVKKPVTQPVNQNQNANQNINANTNTATSTVEIDTSNWKTYRNEEYGFEFKYPEGCTVKESSELSGFDKGKRRNISVVSLLDGGVFNLVMTSKDYSEGVGEGCCFYYSGHPVDFAKLDSIKFLTPFDVRIEKINGTSLLRFYRINSYAAAWSVDSFLIPVNNPEFTNILISSPDLIMTGGGDLSDSAKNDLVNKTLNKDYLKSPDTARKQQIFINIVNTFKFIK